jgi:hypothetical protein
MSLQGRGAVAIWHDIAPEGRADFYAWHGSEHMPERVGIPGFLSGRRFVAIGADLEFFNLYEVESLDVLKGPGYRARLNDPTPWTLAAVKHFRSVARSLCRVAASRGQGQGGLVATLRYDVASGAEEAHEAALVRDVLPHLAAGEGIAAAHLLVADMEASGEVNAEQRARGAANAVPRFALVVEGWGDEAAFTALARRELAPRLFESLGAVKPGAAGVYRHQVTRLRSVSGTVG